MTLPLPAGTYRLDETHSTVEFSVRHLGISKVRGRFTGFDATIVVAADLESSTVSAEVDLSTVNTGNADRDAHLRSADFFRTDTHPQMVFQSVRIADLGGGTYRLDGNLTLNGTTGPQTFTVEFFGTETYPIDGSTHAGFAATGSLSRTDYGIDFNVPLIAGGFAIADRIDIELDVQLVSDLKSVA
jgi:polyisoprenoid-binding protein YceI